MLSQVAACANLLHAHGDLSPLHPGSGTSRTCHLAEGEHHPCSTHTRLTILLPQSMCAGNFPDSTLGWAWASLIILLPAVKP